MVELGNTQELDEGNKTDIALKAIRINEFDNHDSIKRKVTFQDTQGSQIELTIFQNNPDYGLEAGKTYFLRNVKVGSYQGEKNLTPNYDETSIEKVEGDKPDISAGNHLMRFPIEIEEDLTFSKYSISVPGGLQEISATELTHKVASRLTKIIQEPVVYLNDLEIISTAELDFAPDIDGREVKLEVEKSSEKLNTDTQQGRKVLHRILKDDLKITLDGVYNVRGINSIIEKTPRFESEDGNLAAHLKYSCKIVEDGKNDLFLQTRIKHDFKSKYLLSDYINQSKDIEGLKVQHTDQYQGESVAEVIGKTENSYTDKTKRLSGESLANWHLTNDRASEEHIERVKTKNPKNVEITYDGDNPQIHTPEFLRVSPRMEELANIDNNFHEVANDKIKMFPHERGRLMTDFVSKIGKLPNTGALISGKPSNGNYQEFICDIQRENLEFANGATARFASKGLQRHGVVSKPESLNIVFLYPERYKDEAIKYGDKVEKRLNSFNCAPDSFEKKSYELGNEFDYQRASNKVGNIDCAVIVVPRKGMMPKGVDDPYPEFKKNLNLPSQMIEKANLSNSYTLYNLSSAIVAKAGGVPWKVKDMPGKVDAFIGLDVTYDHETGQHIGASANIVFARGASLASKSYSLQLGEEFDEDDIVDAVKQLISFYATQKGQEPENIVIHRDGRLFVDLDPLVERLSKAPVEFDILEITKSGNPRIFNYGTSFGFAQKGTIFYDREIEQAILTTTGKPEFDEDNGVGSPQPLRVNKLHGNSSVKDLAAQVFWLSESHVGSVNRSTRLPITTYYADRCADFASKGYMSTDELVKGVPHL